MSAKSKVVDINRKKKELITFTEEELETLRRTVAGDASSDEFKMFIYLAKNYGLDPFNKEIFFWKKDGKPTIMTSRDGYLKIADRHPQYDGLVSDVEKMISLDEKKLELIINMGPTADRLSVVTLWFIERTEAIPFMSLLPLKNTGQILRSGSSILQL